MAKRQSAQRQKRIQEQRRQWRMRQRWPLLVCSLGLSEEMQERINESARRNHRKPHQDVQAALKWYYLEMWRD